MTRILTISCVTTLATVLAIPAAAQQTRLSAQAQTNAVPFRGQIGRHITFICPGDVNVRQDVYGTDVYTDTSPICAAAAHAGVFTPGKSAAVTIVMGGEAPAFQSTTRNVVRSLAYDGFSSTYTFASDGQPGQVNWDTNLTTVAPDFTEPIVVACPANGDLAADVWGTDVYSDSSSVCVAAVHAGVITFAGGGLITVTRVPKQASFPATNRNGVLSRSWADPTWRSYPQPYSVGKGFVNANVPTAPGAIATGPVTLPGTSTASAQPAATPPAGPSRTSPFVSSQPTVFTPPTTTTATATGTPRTGTIISPDATTATPAPTSTAPVTGVLATTTATATAIPTAPAAPSAGTIPASVTNNPSLSSLPANTGRYRVTVQGVSVQQHTKDTNVLDGGADEIYVAAVAWVWDRQQNQVKTRIMARTVEYGDVGAAIKSPSRIQAGSATGKGGLIKGDMVPTGFLKDAVQAPTSDRLPLLVWDGMLTDAVDGLLIVPSIWERDTAATSFETYKLMWTSAGFVPTKTLTTTSLQLPLPGLQSLASEIQPGLQTLFTLTDLAAQVIDRPIGLTAAPVIEQYKDRWVVITREKLAEVAPGNSTDLAIQYAEPSGDPVLGGTYTLYLKVEHVQ